MDVSHDSPIKSTNLKQRLSVLSPLNIPHTPLVSAGISAGYWSILDLGAPQRRSHQALNIIRKLESTAPFGVRVTRSLTSQRWRATELSQWIEEGLITQVIIDESEDWGSWASLKAKAPGHFELWVEARSMDGALRVNKDDRVNGLIIVAEEAAGFHGEYSAFMWLQHLCQIQLKKPYWMRGGMTLSAMIAALTFGAQRIILDEHLIGCAEFEIGNLQEIFDRVERSHCLKKEIKIFHQSTQISRKDRESIRALNWPKSYFWQFNRRVDYQIENGIGAQWGSQLDSSIVACSASWPSINRFVRRLKNRWGVVPRCVDVLNLIVAELSERLSLLQGQSACALNISPHHLGVTYPIFQGPMTRVSDTPNFALAVAEGGAIPFIALSLLNEEKSKQLLHNTKKSLGDRPWGVGILGFSPPELRNIHLSLIREFKPSAVIIAGGRPSQSRKLEAEGIATYLHTPSPELLQSFLDDGVRRFIFEGSECGGHIGPSSSFALWDAQIDILEKFSDSNEVEAVFAGGIHDASSAGCLTAICSKLKAVGTQISVLMGTAYLFTKEAVDTGAILDQYQDVALQLSKTTTLDTAPGHTTRCAPTHFVEEFTAQKSKLLAEGVRDRELWSKLEQFNVGRLRIASKGLLRRDHQLISVNKKEQIDHGMFMIGEVATLRHQPTTIQKLHEEVTTQSEIWLQDRLRQLPEEKSNLMPMPLVPDEDIAIVGISCLFPKASDHHHFWSNILDGLDTIEEVPAQRWSSQQYYDPEAPAGSKSASKWGGFLDKVPFDPMKFGIPPKTMTAVEPVQLLALEVAARALSDAGYQAIPNQAYGRPFDRENTAVIFGAEAGTDLAAAYSLRSVYPQWLGDLPSHLDQQLPTLTEDSFAGILANVISGRIANRLDLGGVNYTVDAACASSLAALDNAVKSLKSAESNLAICGGADLHNSINDYLMFSSVHALSKTGKCRPFDEQADGIALGEGVAAVVLKRAAEARRDGDRIYALVSSVAGGSDGKALGLTAPRHEGQQRALKRAYQKAKIPIDMVGLVEAHGTGTVVGDRTELQALTELFIHRDIHQKCSLGSVKSMIGHTKCAAGMAGLIKATMALYHKVRPPTLHLSSPNQAYQADTSPFCFERSPRPWIAEYGTRVAGVSAFGFGGTNFHAVLREETEPKFPATERKKWPFEPLVLMASSVAEAQHLAGEFVTALENRKRTRSAIHLSLTSFAFSLYQISRERSKSSLLQAIMCVCSLEEAEEALQHFAQAKKHPSIIDLPPLSSEPLNPSQVAFMFPGQGAQRVSMMSELFVSFPHLHHIIDQSIDHAHLIFPSHPLDRQHQRDQQAQLTDTRNAQPALGMCDLAMNELLHKFGVFTQNFAGHSYGELVALCAAGAIPSQSLSEISAKRGELILSATGASEEDGDAGTMAAVKASAEAVAEVIGSNPRLKDVVLANLNAPLQTVISGPTSQVEEAVIELKNNGLRGRRIPVACAFHSGLVAGAAAEFRQYLDTMSISPKELEGNTVWSNQTAKPYQIDLMNGLTIPEILGSHLASPVRFVEQVHEMIKSDIKVFVEVGPGRILSGLVEKIATESDQAGHIQTVPCAPEQGTLKEFVIALAQLSRLGVQVGWNQVWSKRTGQLYSLEMMQNDSAHSLLWWVDGMRAWPDQGPLPKNYLNPPLVPLQPSKMEFEMKKKELEGRQLESALSHDMIPVGQSQSNNEVALAAKAYFESMQNLAQAQERVMLALLGHSNEQAYGRLPTEAVNHVPVEVAPVFNKFQEYKGNEGGVDFWSTTLPLHEKSKHSAPTPLMSIDPQPKQTTEPSSERIDVHSDSFSIKDTLIDLVSERTGYPVEMLSIDLDLEADLSVDSIKRIEILGTLAENLGLDQGSEDDRDQMIEELAIMKTLGEMIEWLEKKQNTLDESETTGSEQDLRPKAEGEQLPRAVRQWKLAPLQTFTEEQGTLIKEYIIRDSKTYRVINLLKDDSLVPLEKLFITLKQLWKDSPEVEGIIVYTPLHIETQLLGQWGGISGLLKSASREWSNFAHAINVRWVSILNEIEDIEAICIREEEAFIFNLHSSNEVELKMVRYTSESIRLEEEYITIDQNLMFKPKVNLDPQTILVSGGGRGVTAHCVMGLAQQYPENHYILLGRTTHPREANPLDLLLAKQADSEAELRGLIAKQDTGLHIKTLRNRARCAWAQYEITQTLNSIHRSGSQGTYIVADLSDFSPTSFHSHLQRLLHEVGSSLDKISVVIHAAGMIDDQRLCDKSLERFQQVLKPKVNGLYLLYNSLPNVSKWLFFSSIASALGNQGQTDYASANAILDHFAENIGHSADCKAMSIQWGPWKGAGMVDQSLAQVYEQSGVQMISIEEGVSAFMQEWNDLEETTHTVCLRSWPFQL